MTENVRHCPTKISDIPNELLWQIFSYLPERDLAQAQRVCRCWHQVGGDPRLRKGFFPFLQSVPAGASLGTIREEGYRRLTGGPFPQPRVLGTLKAPVGRPQLVHFADQLIALYRFGSGTTCYGIRSTSLTTGEVRTYKLPSTRDWEQIHYHYLGLNDLFLAVARRENPGDRLIITFLNSQLAKADVPELSGEVSKPLERALVTTVAGERWLVLRWLSTSCTVFKQSTEGWINIGIYRPVPHEGIYFRWSDPVVLETPDGIQFVSITWKTAAQTSQPAQCEAELIATKWDPTSGDFDRRAWSRSFLCRQLPRYRTDGSTAGTFSRTHSIKVGNENYTVLAWDNQLYLVPCRPKEGINPGVEWSLELPQNLDLERDFTTEVFPVGERQICVVQGYYPGKSRIFTHRWLLLPDGQTRLLSSGSIRKGAIVALGMGRMKDSYGECYYDGYRRQVKQLVIGGEDSSSGLLSTQKVLIVLSIFLSLYASVRAGEAYLKYCRSPEVFPLADWTIALLFSAFFLPVYGIASGVVQQKLLSQEREWVAAMPLVAIVGLALYYTWDRPLNRALASWTAAGLVAWNRSWSLVSKSLGIRALRVGEDVGEIVTNEPAQVHA
jgi:hypothetical protein